MDLSTTCDKYWRTREQRLALDKQSAELKTKETELQDALIKYMTENKLTALGGQLVRLELKKTDEPAVEDWQKVYEYVEHEHAFDLLYRRINAAAVKERLKDGVSVPGVAWFPVFKLSKSKVKDNGN